MFRKQNSTISDYFVAIQGVWILNAKKCLIISVYAPQEVSEKKMLWSYLNHVIDNWSGETIIIGDFNEVQSKKERYGSIFNDRYASLFNSFISSGGLVEVPLGGCAFTWCHKSGNKISKLDRFLILEGLMGMCLNISAITLDRYLSYHRPILLREVCHDYGPIPFWVFHYWFEWEGFDELVKDTWSKSTITDNNAISKFMKKMKFLKEQIRLFIRDKKESACMQRLNLKGMLTEIDLLIDEKKVDQVLLNKRSQVMNSLHDFGKLESMEIAQKAKIKWSIEGDENSKYFHGILNKKRNQTAIRGILAEGVWIDDPNSVKNEFLSHFKERFDRPCSSRLILDMTYPNRLNLDQIDDLERNVTKEEIKRAVWDCGTDKSPGPDGFTFGFYRRYWDIMEKDVVDAVSFFFTEGMFPKGRNASFIALIPKIQDAKVVKDFRPISLIGSLYKIIAKILANRLVMVLGDLVSEVQSAFIANRQILDGPFILNELIQWCKSKKKQTMIFKIDFEKAYDSVRWDYLDDVLEKFGFGSKWRGWIHNCLHSSKGSILVNGSPTDEFHFRRGLKQGDPLSPFLFILVMESLHLSFQNVVDEGLFKASGLRMNLQKSKLLGIAVEDEKVSRATMKMGCCTLKMPFSYLGIKTLSTGGRLNLLKSVLGSTPIYYMSMFKVPSQVLKCLEDIKRQLFNGADPKEKKMSNSLWTRFIKALYGNSGSIETPSKVAYSSTWLNIVTEFSIFKNQAPRDGVEMEQFRDMIAILKGVELSAMHDRWIWSLVGSGEFSVVSMRKFIDDHRLTGSTHKTRWVKVVPIKINVMTWKFRFDFLPTRLNLSRRGLELQSILCPNCNKEVESTSHIFFACSMVRDLYRKIASCWELSYSEFDSYDDWLDWFHVLRLHSKHRDMLEGVFYAMWWLVWNFQNKSLFDSRSPSKAILFMI
ncbi:RNA-directed DNA polymerase, eukaryota [Tanacetum coccineum]|uniref:RNA-directed DNA polymerase, eukaryota n=1 Tax=Tanacetum coccineum TaxID=301880 RepID=A0ABQ5G2V4_9ASTR